MTNAYSSYYIETAQAAMGSMLHYAVYDLKWDLKDYYRAFINSKIAYRFGIGEPKYVAGMSGIELARIVIEFIAGEDTDIEPSPLFDKTPEYWAGWAVAYYEWCRNIPFDRIDRIVPISEIRDMYTPYHEADITRFVDEMDKRISNRGSVSQLARLRAYAGLTQKALADSSGVSVRMIEQYEQGKKDINHASADTVFRLSRVLNCPMEELMSVG